MVRLFASSMSYINCVQAFDLKDVKPLDQSTDFTNVPSNSVKMVKGHGQIIEWKSSKVTVIEKDSEGQKKHTPLSDSPNGSMKVHSSWDLYILGGQFVEKEA
jgi:hypothetical protein